MSYRSEIITRNKGGRPPIFKTPSEVLKMFEEYVAFVDAHPIDLPQHIVKGNSKGEARAGKVARPLTLQGFMVFCNSGMTWSQFKGRYAEKEGFASVIMRVEMAVRTDQIEGGMGGLYNSNLTARLNGLTDKQDLTSNGKQINIRFIDGANETDRD